MTRKRKRQTNNNQLPTAAAMLFITMAFCGIGLVLMYVTVGFDWITDLLP